MASAVISIGRSDPSGAAAQFLEPPLRGRVHPGDGPAVGEQDQTGTVRRVFQLTGLPEQAHAHSLGDVRGEPPDEPHLLGGKPRPGRFPVQAEVAPADPPYPQHPPELVLQAERREYVPVTVAARGTALGGLHEGPHPRGIPGQVRPLVDVIVQELVLDEIRAGFLRQFLAVRPGEQQGGRVRGGPPERIDRHDLPQPRQHGGPQGVRFQTRPAVPGDRSGQIVERRASEHCLPFTRV